MINQGEVQQLTVVIDPSSGTLAEELNHCTQQLRRAIRELPIHSVESARQGIAPASAKSVDHAVAGMLMVGLLPRVIPALCSVLKEWVSKAHGHKVHIKVGKSVVEFTGKVTAAQAAEMIALALDRGGAVREERSKQPPNGT